VKELSKRYEREGKKRVRERFNGKGKTKQNTYLWLAAWS
jgi:hypothetical protein